MKTAKKVLLCVSASLITLSLALVLAPFTGAIEGDVTAGNTRDGVWDIVRDDILSAESPVASLSDNPTTWTVHPTDNNTDFQTIQSAIDNSTVGDSIEVWNGTYNKFVVRNKQLTIYSRDGANVTIVNAGGYGSAITIKAESCTVDGFMATGSGDFPGDAGIIVKSNGNNIMNNTCCANKYNGIHLSNSSNNMISNNTCVVNNNAGISLWYSAYNTISNNEIGDKNRDGIFLPYSSNNMIRDNKIARNKQTGIFMLNSTTNTISNNSCYENNAEGIYLVGCTNNIIKNNGIWDNDRSGISMMGCTNNIISYNEIYDNLLDGLHISQSLDNVVTNNEICRNSQAGVHVAYSLNNRIYCNDFVDNSKNVNSHDSDSIWNLMSVYTYNGSQCTSYIGNYLSDYDGADYNSDGIGDEPYDIQGSPGNGGTPIGHPVNYTDDVGGAMLGNNIYPLIQPFEFYILDNVLPIIQITSHPSLQDRPSIVYANGNYYVAYQLYEKGYGIRSIYIKKFDSLWKFKKKVEVVSGSAYYDSPSLAFANNKLYVAYISNAEGANEYDYDVIVKEYNPNSFACTKGEKHLTLLQSCQDLPALYYKDGYFYLAYQSWETGNGDIYIKKFDSNWNKHKKVRVTSKSSLQKRPSLTYANGYFYVAYYSMETDNLDIFVKRLNSNLNLDDEFKKQITLESSRQTYPSIAFVNNQFALAYASTETGTWGIYMKKYDNNWNYIEKMKVVDDNSANERRPSMTYAQNNYWIAYVHYLVGNDDWNIFAIIPS